MPVGQEVAVKNMWQYIYLTEAFIIRRSRHVINKATIRMKPQPSLMLEFI